MKYIKSIMDKSNIIKIEQKESMMNKLEKVKSIIIGIVIFIIIGLIFYGIYLFWPLISNIFKASELTNKLTGKAIKGTGKAVKATGKFLTSKKTKKGVSKVAKTTGGGIKKGSSKIKKKSKKLFGKKKRRKKNKNNKKEEQFLGLKNKLNYNDYGDLNIYQIKNNMNSNGLITLKKCGCYIYEQCYCADNYFPKHWWNKKDRAWTFIQNENKYQFGNYFLNNQKENYNNNNNNNNNNNKICEFLKMSIKNLTKKIKKLTNSSIKNLNYYPDNLKFYEEDEGKKLQKKMFFLSMKDMGYL